MNIAIASSGLGHVARGIETWALDTAVALAEMQGYQRSVSREAAKNAKQSKNSNMDVQDIQDKEPCVSKPSCKSCLSMLNPPSLSVTLFCAAPLSHPVNCHVEVLPCLRRSNPRAQQLSNCFPGFTWRWGLKDTYGWEQFTFWLRLWPLLRKGRFDILHVQDPMLAYWCRLFRKWGLVKTKEILAHGTEEPVEFLSKFDYVQHLAPWHLEQTLKKLEEKN